MSALVPSGEIRVMAPHAPVSDGATAAWMSSTPPVGAPWLSPAATRISPVALVATDGVV